jgi:hypothetical protein
MTRCMNAGGQRGPKKRRRNIYPAFDGPGDWESSYVTGMMYYTKVLALPAGSLSP